MKAGDTIKIPDYYGGYTEAVFTVEEFRHCLGIFESDAHREASRFTPLCNLYESGAYSERRYISNVGDYETNEVQAWIDIP